MLTKKEKDKLRDAFNLLDSYGILCHVPGCFDISDDEDAISFADDPEHFYSLRNPN